jgi:hypothetical protein
MVLFFAGTLTGQIRKPIRNYSEATRKVKKGKYKMDQLIGRWQETEKLTSKTKEKVAVIDTFYIRFYKNGTADTKQGNSLVITGTSELFADDYITTSANDFKLIAVTPEKMVLDDLRGFQHNFSKKDTFGYEIKQVPPPKPVADTVKPIIDLSAASLIKNWFVYKTDAIPGFAKPETALIRKLKILGKQSENNFKGEIEFVQFGKGKLQACTLVFAGNMLSIFAEGNSWDLDVFKADGSEMILGRIDKLVYYFQNGN